MGRHGYNYHFGQTAPRIHALISRPFNLESLNISEELSVRNPRGRV